MKKHLILIGSIVLAAIVILLALNFTTDKPNSRKNGFKRNIMANAVVKVEEIEVPKEVVRIANISNDTVYLQTNKPNLIYYINGFKKLGTMKFTLPAVINLESAFNIEVHYPNIYILGLNSRCMLTVNVITRSNRLYPILTPGFLLNAALIDEGNMIVRCIDTSTLNAEFYKVNYVTGSVVKEMNISQKLKDAGFTDSGELLYDRAHNLLVNSRFYSNKINIFDTSLNLVNRYQTIDTVTTSSIKLKVTSTSTSNSNPRKYVSGAAGVSNGNLFIRSYLQADNEVASENRIVIDQYEIVNRKYIGSFYLPYQRGERMKNIIADRNRLFTLFKNNLVKISLLDSSD